MAGAIPRPGDNPEDLAQCGEEVHCYNCSRVLDKLGSAWNYKTSAAHIACMYKAHSHAMITGDRRWYYSPVRGVHDCNDGKCGR